MGQGDKHFGTVVRGQGNDAANKLPLGLLNRCACMLECRLGLRQVWEQSACSGCGVACGDAATGMRTSQCTYDVIGAHLESNSKYHEQHDDGSVPNGMCQMCAPVSRVLLPPGVACSHVPCCWAQQANQLRDEL